MSKSNIHKKVGRQGWIEEEHTTRSELDNYYDETDTDSPSTGKKRSKRKSKKKCDHKHKYSDIIGIFNTDILGRPRRSAVLMKRCSICGKIDGWKHPVIEDKETHRNRQMTFDEVMKVYGNLDVVEYK